MSFLSKVHRKVSSKSSLHSIANTQSPDGLPPSPPTHLGHLHPSTTSTVTDGNTAIVDFGSGSTLMTTQQQHCGDESISSSSSHFTHSPSSTPPKKTWEKNYKSFLKKKSSGTSKHQSKSGHNSSSTGHKDSSTKRILTSSQSVGNATSLLQSKVSQPLFSTTTTASNNRNRSQSPSLEEHLELTKGGFVDGFDLDHSNSQQHLQFRRASTGESSKKSSTNPREAIAVDNRLSHFTHPPSPTKYKESLSSKGGSFFKRVRSRTSTSKSTDDLDASLRRGGSRYSPSNTPPGSVPNTPIQNQYGDNTPSSLSHSGGSSSNRSPGTLGCITLQDGIEKAALLNESLFPPPLTDTTSDGSRRGGSGSPRIRNKLLSSSPKLNALDQVRRRGNSSDTSDSLDSARHRGHTTSSSDKLLSQSPADSKSLLDTARHRGHTSSDKLLSQSPSKLINNNPKSNFSRVQSEYSMGAVYSNLAKLPEGKPANILHNKHLSHGNNTNLLQRNNSLNSDSSNERHEREKRKAFTDFHNMGVDSSSAYLGDDSSLHKNSVFLSSMAYPAGSAGGKAHSRHTIKSSGQPHSFDPKRGSGVSPSTSMGSISETKAQHVDVDDTDYSPERSLRCLRGPEHWKKGERHAIIPGVLSMCPIQVLNNIMSKEETSNNTTSGPSLVSGSSNRSLTSQNLRGSGIGSIISEDDGGVIDSSGWFFADHHQQQQPSLVPTKGVGPLGGGLPRPNSSNMLQPSNFGKIILGKATVAPLGMRSFLNEVYGWCTGVFILRQNYLFEYREGDSLNGLPWGYSHLPLAEAYPHKHFTNALHLDFFERPCIKSGKRSLLLRVESKSERDRWVSLLTSAACMTMHDLYDVDESEGAPAFGHGRYAVVRPAKRRNRRRTMSFSTHQAASSSQGNLLGVSSYESLGGQPSNPELGGVSTEYDCALKIIDKKEFWSRVKKGRERADTLVREAAVQTTLTVQGADAPSFLRLRNLFETGEKLVLELELLKGTDLFQHVSSRGVLDEVEAAHIMRDLLNCLNVLDQVGVAHRDIKPANLLMCQNNNNDGGARIKLADYGMASFVGVDNLVRGRCGTPGFVAPEILLTGVNGGYGNRVDMFSAGVTLYVMLAGYEPFYGESDAELIDANREAKVDFPHSDWHNVSLEGRDLVERLLVVDPAKRLSPREALKHPWVTRRTTTVNRNAHDSHDEICSIF